MGVVIHTEGVAKNDEVGRFFFVGLQRTRYWMSVGNLR